MDPHLDDPLNLDSAIGVDFGQAEDVVVTEEDILGTGHHGGDINMSTDVEFEHIEEQSMLMETEGEEIIDLMSEQFMLTSDSNYVQDDQMTGIMTINSTNEQQNILIKPGAMNLQFVPQTTMSSVDFGQDIQVIQPQIITVQSNQQQTNKKNTVQQLATIMPKPVTVSSQDVLKQKTIITSKSHPVTKPLAIAPKPMTLIKPNMMGTVVKKMSLSNIQPAPKSGSMIAQIGKQLVVLPPGSARKLKLVQSDDSNQLQQLNNDEKVIKTKNIPMQKAFLTKVLLQGSNQTSSETVPSESQSAILTKISSAESQLAGSTRLVTVHHKPASVSSNTGLTTSLPKRHGNEIVRIVKNKEQLSFMKSPTPKSLPAPTSGLATKKIVITSNLNQNVVLKNVSQKQTPVVVSGTQRTQLHPINVPGKGVQYIRLVTNPTNAVTKPLMATKNQPVINVQPKTIIMSDGKGNLIMSSSDKMSHPPPLVMTGSPVVNKVNSKPQQKLVRIAPVGAKASQVGTIPTPRSAQSLLAPITTEDQHKALSSPPSESNGTAHFENSNSLQTIIHEAMLEQNQTFSEVSIDETPHQDIEIEIEREQSPEIDDTSMSDHSNDTQEPQPPVIIIKPEYLDHRGNEQSVRTQEAVVNIDQDHSSKYSQYSEPPSPPAISETELIVRPRKACNCTKSQCLKLYCDCFANGEFCNSCNCTNCHNNLENEELRQKAIRGCLERNPNAFRPKIGKAKNSVGPDTVRRHNKGCNCKRSGCLKNYCECYEAKIACTSICKCLGCRNVEESVERLRRRDVPSAFERLIAPRQTVQHAAANKQPCSFVTSEVIEAVCQCLIAAAMEGADGGGEVVDDRTPFAVSNGQCNTAQPPTSGEAEAVRAVIEEFARCLQDIINAAQHTQSTPSLGNEVNT